MELKILWSESSVQVRPRPPAPRFLNSHGVFVALAALRVSRVERLHFRSDFGCTLAVFWNFSKNAIQVFKVDLPVVISEVDTR